MITETNAVAFRQNLGEMLNRVQYRHESVLIKKDGKPVAALVDARLFERIRHMQDRFDALCSRIAQDFAAVPQDEGMAAIDVASAAVREEMKLEAAASHAASVTQPVAVQRKAKPKAPPKVTPPAKRAR